MRTITLRQLRSFWPAYLLLAPAMALVLIFAYFPAAAGIKYAFYRWNGDDISEYIGLDNFVRAFHDPVLGNAFILVMILIAANLVKMIPSIVTAVAIHRLSSDKARYVYRVAFVIPMIIPGMVWLLLWKYFYNPQVGVLNRLLYASGLMDVLDRLDQVMPALSHAITPHVQTFIDAPLGSLWGMGLLGAAILGSLDGLRGMLRGWMWWIGLLVGAYFLWGPVRAAVLLPIVLAAGELLRRGHPTGRTVLKWIGAITLVAFALLVLLSAAWTEPTKAFGNPDAPPSWLGSPKLIPTAIIFWGFPWVGVVSVLLYLSGLGNIPTSVYEAADIDGCGWFRKFWNIELPLIMTQVRLNLVLMIIGTLQAWNLVFILLSDTGGPGGVGMLPGLYMFRQAFTVAEVGYACAIGLLLFGLTVYLTILNNRYARVSK